MHDSDRPCPAVHLVHGQIASGPALNLLVLGDGFLEQDLEAYRCAVDRMVARLLTVPPFSAYACHMNVYRMDLVSSGSKSGIGVDPACSDAACVATLPTSYSEWSCPPDLPPFEGGPPIVEFAEESPSCAVLDLGTRLCADTKSCWFIRPSVTGEESVALLSTCVADIDAVLILANSGAYSGGAVVAGSPPFATATLWDIGTDAGWDLVTHEIGHALFGLLDEYQSACSSCSFRWLKNVVPGAVLGAGPLIPWQGECSTPVCERKCTYKPACDATAACPADEGGQPCCFPRLSPAVLPDAFVGLVEGGWYRNCGYYRAEKTCQMRQLAQPFCTGCRTAANLQLAGRSIGACEALVSEAVTGPPTSPPW